MAYVAKLTHPQRRERRQRIVTELETGMSMHAVAEKFGVTWQLVSAAWKEFKGGRVPGSPMCGRPPGFSNMPSYKFPRDKWESMDWTTRDVDVARVMGTSRELARKWRIRLGKPKVKGNL